jgi:hypothetical protein
MRGEADQLPQLQTFNAARSAVRHGLCSRNPVITLFESAEAWEEFLAAWQQRLQPVGKEEAFLVEEIALTLWRQRRISRFEAEQVNCQLVDAEHDWIDAAPEGATAEHLAENLRYRVTAAAVPSPEAIQRIQRHEAHLLRSYKRRLQDLDDLQRRRKREATPEQPTQNSTQLTNCNSVPSTPQPPRAPISSPAPVYLPPAPPPTPPTAANPVPAPAPARRINTPPASPPAVPTVYGQPGYRYHLDDG